jgi:hypothetical protein
MATKKTTKKQSRRAEPKTSYVRSFQERAKGVMETVKTDGEKYARKSFETCKDFAGDVVMHPGKVLTDIFESGKKCVLNFEKGTRKKISGAAEKGREALDDLPTMKAIGNKISNVFGNMPSHLNLASKKDIDKLITTMEALNKKLDNLSSKYSAS